MDILFLLIPLSVLLALVVMGVLAWAVWSGQFEELDGEGQRILGAIVEQPDDLPAVPCTNAASLMYINSPESVVQQNRQQH